MNSTSTTTEHNTEHNYILVNQVVNIGTSNQGVIKKIEHISNGNRKRFKGRKTQDRKMNKQKIQLNYNKKHYAEQNKQYKNKDNIIKDSSNVNVSFRLTESFVKHKK